MACAQIPPLLEAQVDQSRFRQVACLLFICESRDAELAKGHGSFGFCTDADGTTANRQGRISSQ